MYTEAFMSYLPLQKYVTPQLGIRTVTFSVLGKCKVYNSFRTFTSFPLLGEDESSSFSALGQYADVQFTSRGNSVKITLNTQNEFENFLQLERGISFKSSMYGDEQT
jgi:hypothetical protein